MQNFERDEVAWKQDWVLEISAGPDYINLRWRVLGKKKK